MSDKIKTKHVNGVDVVTLPDAAKIMGITIQTIYNRIKNNDDADFTKNLVRHIFISPVSGKEIRRYYLAAEFVKSRAKDPDEASRKKRREVVAQFEEVYYDVYDMIESRIDVLAKHKDDDRKLVSMKAIDAIIASYIYKRYEQLWKKPLPKSNSQKRNKKNLIMFAVSSFYCGSVKDASAILEGMRMLHKELTGGMGEEELLA